MGSPGEVGGTLSKVGGGLLLLGLLIAFIVITSILGSLAIHAFTYPPVLLGFFLNIILAIVLFATEDGIIMIVAGVLGLVFSFLLVGGIVGIIGGILGLVGGILTLTAESEVTRVCPQCGKVLTEDAKFCPRCGKELA